MAGYRVGYKAGLGDGVSLAGIRWDYCIALVQSKSDSVADPWKVMAAEFKKSLDKFKVPAAEQAALFEMVGKTKSDIVVRT